MSFVISMAICLFLFYTVTLFVSSRRRRLLTLLGPDNLLFVFVLPCLNEELVIGKSLERLLSLPGQFPVLVIDDASDDATADVVRSVADTRVHLLQRSRPNARKGKGPALNCAYRYLLQSDLIVGRSLDDVVLVVLDADGRLELNALVEVAPFFRDPRVGGVQIGVRMLNARTALLARMQDLEFLSYNEIFQRGRQRLGSVGLGGNGQFTRLSALHTLGDEPWSNFLTEDLDLGIRLLAGGWNNAFCPTTYVSQQALTKIRPLIRQRTRWFQGHLQTWRRLPMVLGSDLPSRTMLDLVNLIILPGLLLAISLLPLAVTSMFFTLLVSEPSGLAQMLFRHYGIDIFSFGLLTFGLVPFNAYAYWLHERTVSFPRAIGYACIYALYGYMWFIVGWCALFSVIVGRASWAKTARLSDADGPRHSIQSPHRAVLRRWSS